MGAEREANREAEFRDLAETVVTIIGRAGVERKEVGGRALPPWTMRKCLDARPASHLGLMVQTAGAFKPTCRLTCPRLAISLLSLTR